MTAAIHADTKCARCGYRYQDHAQIHYGLLGLEKIALCPTIIFAPETALPVDSMQKAEHDASRDATDAGL